ncbi:Sugar (pentulose and hexulose) kinase (plasmid) [Marinovum algicola DG 898]|nr:Sugar (pentulose and hexulose) kinase [Marinovum algicola DG 898]
MRLRLDGLQGDAGRPERIVAASGGAKNALWLRIKASMFGVPYLVPEELECGVVGAAMLMATATGDAPDLAHAARRMVRYAHEIAPDPGWADTYNRMAPVFHRLYQTANDIYPELDKLP